MNNSLVSPSNSLLSLLIIDDHPIFSWGLSALLSSLNLVKSVQIFPLDQVDVIQWLQANPTDFILVDLFLSNLDGFDLIEKVRKHSDGTKILVISNRNDKATIFSAFKLGANGYIHKSKKIDDLYAAIVTILEGNFYLPSEWADNDFLHSLCKRMNTIPLREREVLWLISCGMNSKEIAQKMFVSEHTVQTYRKRLFKRFEVNTAIELVKKATKQGFL